MSDLTNSSDIATQRFPRSKTRNQYYHKYIVCSRYQRERSQSKQHSFSIKKLQERRSPKNTIYYDPTKQRPPKNQLQLLVKERRNKYKRIDSHEPSMIMKTEEQASQKSDSHTLESFINQLNNLDVNDINNQQSNAIKGNQQSSQSEIPSFSQTVTIQKQDLMIQPSIQLFLCKICLEFYQTVEIKSHLQYCIAPSIQTQYIDKWRKLNDLLQIASSRKSSPELNIVSQYMKKMEKQRVNNIGKMNFMNKFGINTSEQKQKLFNSLEQKMIIIRWIVAKLKPEIFDPESLQWVIQQILSKIIRLSQ